MGSRGLQNRSDRSGRTRREGVWHSARGVGNRPSILSGGACYGEPETPFPRSSGTGAGAVSDLWNISILLRPGVDLPDVHALLDARGATVLTSHAETDGGLELVVVVDAGAMGRLADALPAGTSWRVLGVRGNLS